MTKSKWMPLKFDKKNMTQWNWMCQHHAHLSCGDNVDVGAFTYMNAKHGIRLAEDVQIGSHCSLYTVSTIDDKQGPIKIGKKSKIGTHSTVMPGVTIGDNVVIGAYSFVNKNIPSNVTAWGIPIKIQSRKKNAKKR